MENNKYFLLLIGRFFVFSSHLQSDLPVSSPKYFMLLQFHSRILITAVITYRIIDFIALLFSLIQIY